MKWEVKSASDTDTVYVEKDAFGRETGRVRYEFSDGRVQEGLHPDRKTRRYWPTALVATGVGVAIGVLSRAIL